MATVRASEALKTSGQEIQAMEVTFQGLLDDADTLVKQITAGWRGKMQVAFLADYDKAKTQLADLPPMVKGLGTGAVSAAETLETVDASGAQRG
jgi:uncharacterized protein YukE